MTIGIYKLNFIGTDKVYIGQCKRSIEDRFKEHQVSFRRKTQSIKMNAAYAEFGMPTLEILAECSIEELNSFENETIEIYNAVDNGFNSLHRAEDTPNNGGSPPGELHSMSKYSNAKIIEVFNLLVDNVSLKEVVKLTNVSYRIVTNISCGTNHLWLAKEYPEKYTVLMSLKGVRMSTANSAQSQGIIYPNIQDPLGNIYSISNGRAFAKEHRLDQGHLGRVLNGKTEQHKGWRLA